MLEVSVLGPVELRRDGTPIPVRPGKTTEALVRLALEAGQLVRTERLIDDLWSDDAATTGRNTLQTKISSLRRALGDAATVSGSTAGYTLEIEPGAVDALAVPQLAAAARAALDAGDAAGALSVCDRVLVQFRGEILCDAGEGEWLTPHRVRLEDTRLQLLEDRLAARLHLGATGDATAELEALVAEHPLRERLWELLITALYRAGRQADALAAYARVRTILGEELGLDPGPALQAIEHQVLTQDPALDARRRVPGNLPALTSSIVGRAAELDELVARVATDRLVTMVGPAGVGKTRLAMEVARATDRVAGSWLIRLEGATPASVTQTVAAALGVAGGTEPVVLEHLRGSDVLLVIDNCEHVIDSVADLVPRLLGAAPVLRVLCTSQVPLGIAGESVWSLAPLAEADSVALFAERAGEHRASFAMDAATETTVGEVCRTLDGLPLAIELAAARTKTLSVDDIARRLDDRFALLRDPTTRRPERQRALAAAIEWSYELLFPDDQRGLWALACFAGGGSLAAAEHVLAALDVPGGSALDTITRLADRSLVTVDTADADGFRYRLLDSVRAFALDRLDASGMADTAFAAHAQWFGDAAAIAAVEVRGPAQARSLAVARSDRANIDAALAWSGAHDPLLALRIATGFGWTWVVIGDGVPGSGRVRAALAAAGADAPAEDRALAWSHVAWLDAGNDVEQARGAADASVNAADASGDVYLGAVSRLALAFVFVQQGKASEAIALLDACRSTFRDLDRAWDEGAACILTAHAAFILGDARRAKAACDDAERVVRPVGDDWGLDHLDATLGQLARAERRFADAAVHLQRAADAADRLGFATSEGYHLVNLGRVHHQAGDYDAAVTTLERAIEIGRTTAELRVVALAQVRLGRTFRALGDRDAARAVLTAADDWYRSAGGGESARVAACLLAALDAEEDPVGAAPVLEAVLAEARAEGQVEVEVLALDALAQIDAEAGRPVDALARLVAADGLMPAVAHLIDDRDRIDGIRARALLD